MATFQVFISNEQQQQQDVKCAMPCALCIVHSCTTIVRRARDAAHEECKRAAAIVNEEEEEGEEKDRKKIV